MPRSAMFLAGICLWLAGCAGAAPLPPRAVALNRAGAEALARGDLETADARLSLALEYSPRFVEALVNQGLVELQRGNFERAKELITRARRLNSDVAQPHHALGILAERQPRPDVASRHYYDALAADPGFPPAPATLARRLSDAAKRALELDPSSSVATFAMAKALESLGDPSAISWLRRASERR